MELPASDGASSSRPEERKKNSEVSQLPPQFSACPAIAIPHCRDFPLVPDRQPVALPPSPRHPQGATSCWIVVECREQDAEEVVTMTKTAMLDGMKQLAKDCPVEVEGVIGKTWGSTK